MDLVKLRYFREFVICGSVTLAAKRLGVSQPAVSKQLSLLSEELGCRLWTKRKQNLRLTESGRTLFQHAEIMLEQVRLMKKGIADLNYEGEVTGALTIGCGPLLSRVMLPDLIVDFLEQYPKVKLSIYETDSIWIPDLISEGKIDIGLGAGNLSKNREARFIPLLKDEYLIIHSSELVIPGEKFQIDQIYNYPFINYMSGSTVLASLSRKFKLKKLDSVLYARNTETIIEFVRRNAGIAFMPEYMYKILVPEGIVAKRVDRPIYQNIGLYCRAEKNNSAAFRIFEAKVREKFKTLNRKQ